MSSQEGRRLQATFRKDILYFGKVVGQLGNPFVATSLELVALDTQNVMEESVVASLSEIREVGQTLHAAYVGERLEYASVPISYNHHVEFRQSIRTAEKTRKGVGVQ